MSMQFSSEGFDLDATGGGGGEQDVVLELGGGVTRQESKPKEEEEKPLPPHEEEEEEEDDILAPAQEWKAKGNEEFKQHNWLEAYDMYTSAIEAAPGVTGEEMLQQQAAWEEEQNIAARKRLTEQEEERRRKQDSKTPSEQSAATPPPLEKPEKFVLTPLHPHGATLAIFYSNRAACLLQLQRHEEAVKDCNVALLADPTYIKGWMRRATAHERLEQTDLALQDAKEALELETNSTKRKALRKTVARLQKLEDERLEKLKAETMGKLKDLGNSILGNFGLSLDNFQAQQDPQTGSYNISFQQNS